MTESTQLQKTNGAAEVVPISEAQFQKSLYESLALRGDISQLTAYEKTLYMQRLCESLGLNPLTQPFVPLLLKNKNPKTDKWEEKEILYATRGCTDQLTNTHRLTREIVKTDRVEDVYIATCKASGPDGRFEISTGAVSIAGLKGNDLANALMKAETKAKRRATLSYCGLGFLDESEIETIPRDRVEFVQPATKGQLVDAARSDAATDRKALAASEITGRDYESEVEKHFGPPALHDAAIDNAMSEQDLAWRKEIDQLGFKKMRAKFDEQPENREAIYIAVLREAVKRVFASEQWALTDDGTAGYLEKFGISGIDGASRGQLEAAIADLRGLGNL
jgi:hypothetical protein